MTIQRTADTETIAGLSTRKYRVLSDGTLYEELWLASDPALLRELIVARAPETFGRMSGCLGTAGGAQRVEATEEYRRLYSEGWPLKAVFHGDGGATPGTAGDARRAPRHPRGGVHARRRASRWCRSSRSSAGRAAERQPRSAAGSARGGT